MQDTYVTEEDLKKFLFEESIRSILKIKHLKNKNLQEFRDYLLPKDLRKIDILSDRYNSNTEAIEELSKDLTIDNFIQIFEIKKLDEKYLVRSDFDRKITIELEKEWLMKVLTNLNLNKTKRDAFWRDLSNKDINEADLKILDIRVSNEDLASTDLLVPSIDEVVKNLTRSVETAKQLRQIFYSIIIGQRFEDVVIVISGHADRKRLFEEIVKIISRNRIVKSSVKKLQKDSFERSISRAILISSAASMNEISKVLEENRSQVVIIEDKNFIKSKNDSIIKVSLDNTSIDNLENKIKVLRHQEFVSNAFKELDLDEDLKTNQYFRCLSDEDRLNDFILYLNDLSIIGYETLSSSMIYALYLDYCRYKKIESDFKTQSQFSREIAKSLLKFRYVLSDKSERVRKTLSNSKIDSEIIEDLLKTHLNFKDIYETNKISKVYNLRFDIEESHIEEVRQEPYAVTEIAMKDMIDCYIGRIKQNEYITSAATRLMNEVNDVISLSIKQSTFKTIELSKYLIYLVLTEENVKEKISKISSITQLPLSIEVRTSLTKDLYRKADTLDKIDRSFEYDKLDKEMIEILQERKDLRSKKLTKTFSKSITQDKKQKIRESLILEICKNVRLR